MERFKSKKLLSAAGLLTLVGGAVAYIVLAAAVSCNTDGNCVGPTPQADLITLDDPAGGTGVTVDGLGGNDRIIPGTGGAEANTLTGNTGNDLILGGASGDTINGNAGNDRLDGAGGNDTIGDNNGDNFCADTDEPGADRIVGGAGNEARICGGDGNDFIDAGDGADAVVFGNAGNDIMYGDTPGGTSPGNDTMDGGAGNDLLFGLDGDDSLTGGAGADRLIGGIGDDTLTGDAGSDILEGGPGNDNNQTGGASDGIPETDTYIIRRGDVPASQIETIFCTSEAGDTGVVRFVSFPLGIPQGVITTTTLIQDPVTFGHYNIMPGPGTCILHRS
jgi:Ca2+-binding RTX toxin-like protein